MAKLQSGTVVYGNLVVNTYITATGNVTSGNLITAGLVSATGNITGNYFIGNGSQLTGLAVTQLASGNSNVSINSSGGNIEFAVSGVADTAVVSPGELTVYGVYSNPKTISSNVIITPNINSLLIGPVSVAAGINIYVPDSSTLNVV